MNDRDKRHYDSYKHVQVFGAANTGDFAAGSLAQKNFGYLDEVITGLKDVIAAQMSNANTSLGVLYDTVKLDIQNITRTAAIIDLDEPGFADTFHPPKAYNPAALLTAADNFLLQLAVNADDDAATKTAKAALVAKFVAHEMKADFVATLQADRKAIDDTHKEMESDSEDQAGYTAIITPLIKKGTKAVNTLDVIMHNKYTGQPDKLAAWVSASHVERDPQRHTPPPTPPAPPAK